MSSVQEGIIEDAPSAAAVRDAAARLDGWAVKTPLIENAQLNERAGGRVLIKAETLQHFGSFKFRGAMNLLAQLTVDERRRGVLAWSSGNHAQGVAYAAKLLGAPACIVMPADAPRIKIDQVRALGAEIVFYDRYTEDREAIGRAIAANRGLTIAPPYDHPQIMAGQGTVALEAFEQAAAAGAHLDAFVACCGGGGLAAGCATILSEISPETEVWVAEPAFYDDTGVSLRTGARARADLSKRTICDAIATPTPGELTLPILQRHARGGVAVSDEEVVSAMAFAFRALKLVVEPGGAVALAAVLGGKIQTNHRTVAITLSGANVDPTLFATILERAD